MKILLVDDDEFVRALMIELLTSEGFDVTGENSVDGAIAVLAREKFDLLITDIVMPNKDGGQLMRHVRTSGIQMPILAITGGLENAQDDYANYADLFADATMIKPVNHDELIETVKRLGGGK